MNNFDLSYCLFHIGAPPLFESRLSCLAPESYYQLQVFSITLRKIAYSIRDRSTEVNAGGQERDLTRRSAGPRTALKVCMRTALRGLRWNGLLGIVAAIGVILFTPLVT